MRSPIPNKSDGFNCFSMNTKRRLEWSIVRSPESRWLMKGLPFLLSSKCVFHVILFSILASLMAAFVPVALGVGDGLIPNDAMRASSVLDRYHVPSQARLNNTKQGKSGGAWKPKVNDKKQYLEVDLGVVTNILQVGVFGLHFFHIGTY